VEVAGRCRSPFDELVKVTRVRIEVAEAASGRTSACWVMRRGAVAAGQPDPPMCATWDRLAPRTAPSGLTHVIKAFFWFQRDNDFYQRSLLFGAPPKVVWSRECRMSPPAIQRPGRDLRLLLQSRSQRPRGL
jgi:hypothetical protein